MKTVTVNQHVIIYGVDLLSNLEGYQNLSKSISIVKGIKCFIHNPSIFIENCSLLFYI